MSVRGNSNARLEDSSAEPPFLPHLLHLSGLCTSLRSVSELVATEAPSFSVPPPHLREKTRTGAQHESAYPKWFTHTLLHGTLPLLQRGWDLFDSLSEPIFFRGIAAGAEGSRRRTVEATLSTPRRRFCGKSYTKEQYHDGSSSLSTEKEMAIRTMSTWLEEWCLCAARIRPLLGPYIEEEWLPMWMLSETQRRLRAEDTIFSSPLLVADEEASSAALTDPKSEGRGSTIRQLWVLLGHVDEIIVRCRAPFVVVASHYFSRIEMKLRAASVELESTVQHCAASLRRCLGPSSTFSNAPLRMEMLWRQTPAFAFLLDLYETPVVGVLQSVESLTHSIMTRVAEEVVLREILPEMAGAKWDAFGPYFGGRTISHGVLFAMARILSVVSRWGAVVATAAAVPMREDGASRTRTMRALLGCCVGVWLRHVVSITLAIDVREPRVSQLRRDVHAVTYFVRRMRAALGRVASASLAVALLTLQAVASRHHRRLDETTSRETTSATAFCRVVWDVAALPPTALTSYDALADVRHESVDVALASLDALDLAVPLQSILDASAMVLACRRVQRSAAAAASLQLKDLLPSPR